MVDLSRRQFLRLRLASGVQLSLEESSPSSEDPPPIIRPPGALPEADTFLQACTGCGQCATACPFEAIKLFGPEAGRDENTPYLVLAETPCRWCETFPCIQACGDEALILDPPPTPISQANINLDHCMNTQGILCDECVSVCPSRIHAISMQAHRPILDAALCTGCGLCAWHCPAEPQAIALQDIL